MLKSATFRCRSQDPIPSITDGLLLFELSSTRIALLCITTEPPERSDTGLPSSAQCTISLNRKNLKKPRWKSEPTVISKSEIPPLPRRVSCSGYLPFQFWTYDISSRRSFGSALDCFLRGLCISSFELFIYWGPEGDFFAFPGTTCFFGFTGPLADFTISAHEDPPGLFTLALA